MWPYPWTHVGTPSHLGHMDRVAATMPSQAHAGAAQEAPDIGQWQGQDVPLVRPSSCNVKGGIPSSRTYLPTYLRVALMPEPQREPGWVRAPESSYPEGIGSVASSLPLAGLDKRSILEIFELISVWAETANFQLPTPRG